MIPTGIGCPEFCKCLDVFFSIQYGCVWKQSELPHKTCEDLRGSLGSPITPWSFETFQKRFLKKLCFGCPAPASTPSGRCPGRGGQVGGISRISSLKVLKNIFNLYPQDLEKIWAWWYSKYLMGGLISLEIWWLQFLLKRRYFVLMNVGHNWACWFFRKHWNHTCYHRLGWQVTEKQFQMQLHFPTLIFFKVYCWTPPEWWRMNLPKPKQLKWRLRNTV